MGARVVRYQNLRAAADLTATTVYDTPAVPCFGAKHVIFVFKATNANTPAACTLQVSGASTAGWLTTSGQRLGVIGAASGNSLANGIAMQIAGSVAGGEVIGDMFLGHAYARAEITGHATLSITGLSIDAYVVYDSDWSMLDSTNGAAVPIR